MHPPPVIYHVNRWGRAYASPSLSIVAGLRLEPGRVLAPVIRLRRPDDDGPGSPAPAAPRMPVPRRPRDVSAVGRAA